VTRPRQANDGYEGIKETITLSFSIKLLINLNKIRKICTNLARNRLSLKSLTENLFKIIAIRKTLK
jgi:hypothetical protein